MLVKKTDLKLAFQSWHLPTVSKFTHIIRILFKKNYKHKKYISVFSVCTTIFSGSLLATVDVSVDLWCGMYQGYSFLESHVAVVLAAECTSTVSAPS